MRQLVTRQGRESRHQNRDHRQHPRSETHEVVTDHHSIRIPASAHSLPAMAFKAAAPGADALSPIPSCREDIPQVKKKQTHIAISPCLEPVMNAVARNHFLLIPKCIAVCRDAQRPVEADTSSCRALSKRTFTTRKKRSASTRQKAAIPLFYPSTPRKCRLVVVILVTQSEA
ncbi:hypothetical protein CERZMDRAFT_91611 [Cercospora zeae-maydis SCOH1-5]|uniref:Uncharacterized protein n=1 Tax=Cercospora zeae-maydis SCOH1-5 TaxID=717836 RepID=A0A6A6F4R0_9PEZI|nr:hypothetical protein CERZMDRAFT_91611 [Cercospora zeae-maydis SCOH1-5]